MLLVALKALKDKGIKTTPYDNGTENVTLQEINKNLGCEGFFCNAYHSWERGSIENRNEILRQFFPNETNFGSISVDAIYKIQKMINNFLIGVRLLMSSHFSVRFINLICLQVTFGFKLF